MFNYFPRRASTVQLPTRHQSPGGPTAHPAIPPRPASRSTHPTSRTAPNADETLPSLWARFPLSLSHSPLLLQPFPIMHAVRVHCPDPATLPLWSRSTITLVTLLHHTGRVHCSCCTTSPLLGPLHSRNLLARLTPQRLAHPFYFPTILKQTYKPQPIQLHPQCCPGCFHQPIQFSAA